MFFRDGFSQYAFWKEVKFTSSEALVLKILSKQSKKFSCNFWQPVLVNLAIISKWPIFDTTSSEWDYLKCNCAKILKSGICWTKKKRKRASLFDNKKCSKQRKTCVFLRRFPLIYCANARLAQNLTATLVILAMWTYAWCVGTTSLHCLITKRAQNQENVQFYYFSADFLLTLS